MDNREKLIEILRVPIYPHLDADPAEVVADYLLDNGVTIQKWIPVSERLPEGEELVLIHCKNGAMFVGYCGKQYCDFERRWRIKTALNSTKLLNLGRVTHWMPLPEAPKEERV